MLGSADFLSFACPFSRKYERSCKALNIGFIGFTTPSLTVALCFFLVCRSSINLVKKESGEVTWLQAEHHCTTRQYVRSQCIWDIYVLFSMIYCDILIYYTIHTERNIASRGTTMQSYQHELDSVHIDFGGPMSRNSWFLGLKCLPYLWNSHDQREQHSCAEPLETKTIRCLSQKENTEWTEIQSYSYSDLKSSRENSVRTLGDTCLELLSLRPHCLGILNAMGWGEHIVQLWPVWQRSRRSDHWGRGLLFSMLVCLQAMWLACYEFPERCLCYLLLAVAWGPQSVKADFMRSKKASFLWQREASLQGEAETAQLKSGPQVPS